jgi:hypothetical protein
VTAVDIRPALLPATSGCVADLPTFAAYSAATRPEPTTDLRPDNLAGERVEVAAGEQLQVAAGEQLGAVSDVRPQAVAGEHLEAVAGERFEVVAGTRPDDLAGEQVEVVANAQLEVVAGERPRAVAGTRLEGVAGARPRRLAGTRLEHVAGMRLDHLALAERYAAEPEQWPVAPRFNPRERWYHRLASEPDHEVWLLTWLPGQGTDLHDHGGSAGAFHIYAGTLTEDTVTVGARPEEADGLGAPARIVARELGEGASRRFGSRHIHRIVNRSPRPAISIHVYGPALTTMTRYRITQGALDVVTVEKAGVQW